MQTLCDSGRVAIRMSESLQDPNPNHPKKSNANYDELNVLLVFVKIQFRQMSELLQLFEFKIKPNSNS